jgi:hypothetical protein
MAAKTVPAIVAMPTTAAPAIRQVVQKPCSGSGAGVSDVVSFDSEPLAWDAATLTVARLPLITKFIA